MTQLLASSAKTRTNPRGCAMIIKFASAATPLSAVEVRVFICKLKLTVTVHTCKCPFRSVLYSSTVSYQASFFVAVCWTKWYDRDNPSGTGDWELLRDLMAENPGEIWYYPMYIEVVTTDTLTPAFSTGETFHMYVFSWKWLKETAWNNYSGSRSLVQLPFSYLSIYVTIGVTQDVINNNYYYYLSQVTIKNNFTFPLKAQK